MTGKVHSFQSLGAVDGPGIRFVVFLQGCNLLCGCCHNPDTRDCSGGKSYSAEEIVKRAERYKEYFGADGGITISGGEPILQPEFAREIFALAHRAGINTCLDTSGSVINEKVKELLSECDRVLLDIKYTTDEDYRKYAGCSIDAPLAFLDLLDKMGIKTTVRQVIIPSLNDTSENIERLKMLTEGKSCVDTIELLPFRKVCEIKYGNMGIPFPFAHIPEPTKEKMDELSALLKC